MPTDSIRRAIVTGGSSGIGRATALGLAAEGCHVGITYRANQPGAEEVVSELTGLGVKAAAIELDLGRTDTTQQTIDSLVNTLGGVDVLVNNAGTNRRASILDEDIAGWERTLAVNLIGPWACTKAVAPHMISHGRGGRIINVTSVLAFTPLSRGGAYCASKAGLELLTKVMALELAPHGITVNAVAPGHTATPMNFDASDLDESTIERPVIPVARAADAGEIANAIVFLAAANRSYATGASLLVDGGLILHSGPEALESAIGRPRKG